MTDDTQKLLSDCINGESFAWERFVDKYLPLVNRVVDFTAREQNKTIDERARSDIAAGVFRHLAADDFSVLKGFDGQSNLGTFITVIAQRAASAELARASASAESTPKPP